MRLKSLSGYLEPSLELRIFFFFFRNLFVMPLSARGESTETPQAHDGLSVEEEK